MFAALTSGIWSKVLAIAGIAALGLIAVTVINNYVDANNASHIAQGQAEQRATQEAQANQDLALAAAQAVAQAKTGQAAVSRAHAAGDQAAAALLTLQKETAHAPPTDDGPIAPVVRRGLDRLRQLYAPAAGAGGGGADPTGAGTPGPDGRAAPAPAPAGGG